jgi:hypothetical protein
MSTSIIISKLLDTIKDEIKKDENIDKIKYDILKPIIEQIFYIMYPYFAFISLIFIIVIVVIFIILFLNIKICYSK